MLPAGSLTRLATPSRALALAMAACLLLAVLPPPWLTPLRRAALDAMVPGQRACAAMGANCRKVWASAQAVLARADRLAATEAGYARLARENALLRAEADALRAARLPEAANSADALLVPQAVPARVLGRQARAYLAARQLIDVGTASGSLPGDWVLAVPGLVDRGRDAGFQPGDLALSGRCLWGQVVEVGTHVSVVRTVTEAGYRGVVRVVSPHRPVAAEQGPQGVVEGNGESLARVRLVPVTEAVAVGDWVVTADGDGFLPEPLLVGRVERVERTELGSHWEIWMAPAVPPGEPPAVAVLRAVPNAARLAGSTEARR